MPRLAVSQISRLTSPSRSPGWCTLLPRQRTRLEALAISRAAWMPLPATSPRSKHMRPSGKAKKSKKSPETVRAGTLTPCTGKSVSRRSGSRESCSSATSSSSRCRRCWVISVLVRVALWIASAAEAASTRRASRSRSANNPSPTRLLITSMAPIWTSLRLMGAHRIERVVKPVFSSTERRKLASRVTSRTIRVACCEID